jgi:hypothetical protein
MFEAYDIAAGRRRCVTGSLKLANEVASVLLQRGDTALLCSSERCRSPVADLATAKTPMARLNTDVDGFTVSFDANELLIFPTYDGAIEAYRTAKQGQRMLAACLATAPSRKAA